MICFSTSPADADVGHHSVSVKTITKHVTVKSGVRIKEQSVSPYTGLVQILEHGFYDIFNIMYIIMFTTFGGRHDNR
jgi:hypothetical protein